jgi:SAM-dependent methyltransferase
MGLAFLAKHVPAVARTMVEGGGIPYDDYRPEFTDLMDRGNRILYDNLLIDGYIGAVDGLRARLEAGVRVADLGCGSGHVVNLLGRAFPRSSFVGYDVSADALDAGRLEAKEYGLENVSFEQRDVARLEPGLRFDLITAFDAIHDQARPRDVLAGARRSLAEGGLFVMVDIHASSNLEDNLDHVGGPAIYGSSLFHCMQVSLAEGGEGLGSMWGEQVARELLAGAGFSSVEIAEGPPEDFVNAIYVCRP